MTKAEVMQILGPCTDSSTGRWPPGPNWFETVIWEDPGHAIVVRFSVDITTGEDRGAVEKSFIEKESVLYRTLRWLGIHRTSNTVYENEELK
jgi:hypothetical protein